MVMRLMSFLFDFLHQKLSRRYRKRLELDRKFIDICDSFAKLSKCVSYKVGCILVKNERVISTGINGTPPGYVNCCEVFDKDNFDRDTHHAFSDQYEVHAEQNAVANAAKYGIAIEGSTAYCNVEPCIHCSKILSMTGIKRIVYSRQYDKFDGDYRKRRNIFLKKCKIKIQRVFKF